MRRAGRWLSLLAAFTGCATEPTLDDVQRGRIEVDDGERAAVAALFAAAGVDARTVLLGRGRPAASLDIVDGHVVHVTVTGRLPDLRALDGLNRLHTLDLQFVQVEHLDGVEKAPAVEALYVDARRLSTLSPLGRCAALRTLHVRNGRAGLLETLPALPALRHLVIADDEGGPSGLAVLGRAPHLEQLHLSGRIVQRLDTLPALPALEELHAQNAAAVAPLRLAAPLPALRTLAVRDSRVPELELPTLAALEELDLRQNHLTTLAGLAPQPRLRTLDVSGNEGLADVDALEAMPSLQRLDVTGTRVGALPAGLDETRVAVMARPGERERNREVQRLVQAFLSRQDDWVTRLPHRGGTLRGRSGGCRSRSGTFSGTQLTCDWRIDELEGAVPLAALSGEVLESMKHRGPVRVRVRLSVGSGSARAYFREVWDVSAMADRVARDPDAPALAIRLGAPAESETYRTGFRFAEASPVKPAETSGVLHWVGGDAVFWIGAIEGIARDLQVHVET